MHIHKAIWALKIKVALKIQMSLRKLSAKVSAAAGGDGGVPSACRLYVSRLRIAKLCVL